MASRYSLAHGDRLLTQVLVKSSLSQYFVIAIRLSPRLLATLRRMAAKQGKPYQTLIHELLEKAASLTV